MTLLKYLCDSGSCRQKCSCSLCTAKGPPLRSTAWGVPQNARVQKPRRALCVCFWTAGACPLDTFWLSVSPPLLPLICFLFFKLLADADDIQGCIFQEVKPWVCCAPQGDMIYDPSWHHPPPLITYYSKMVFETGQFDDAEDWVCSFLPGGWAYPPDRGLSSFHWGERSHLRTHFQRSPSWARRLVLTEVLMFSSSVVVVVVFNELLLGTCECLCLCQEELCSL